jgi:PAS domain
MGIAPRRFEIEPAKIAALLPQTFIVENAGMLGYRFRLTGTKIANSSDASCAAPTCWACGTPLVKILDNARTFRFE